MTQDIEFGPAIDWTKPIELSDGTQAEFVKFYNENQEWVSVKFSGGLRDCNRKGRPLVPDDQDFDVRWHGRHVRNDWVSGLVGAGLSNGYHMQKALQQQALMNNIYNQSPSHYGLGGLGTTGLNSLLGGLTPPPRQW